MALNDEKMAQMEVKISIPVKKEFLPSIRALYDGYQILENDPISSDGLAETTNYQHVKIIPNE